MDAIEALMSRRSYARGNLIEPAPSEVELETILQAAMTVPDHGNLKPWRFVVVHGQGIQDLSLLVKEKYATSMSEEHLEAFVREIASTPMMIFVCSNLTLDHHVPVLDQHLAGGAACEHILLACHAMGFAGIWHSLEVDDDLRHLMQLKPEDNLSGVLSIGTPKRTSKAKRKPFSDYTQTWDMEHGLQKWKVDKRALNVLRGGFRAILPFIFAEFFLKPFYKLGFKKVKMSTLKLKLFKG